MAAVPVPAAAVPALPLAPLVLCLGLLLGMGPLAAAGARAQEVRLPPPDPQGTLTLISENDAFFGGSDRYYSNGALAAWMSPSAELPAPFAWVDRQLDWVLGPGNLRWGVSLGHNIYTPEDRYSNVPDPRDRPYSGHFYAAFSLARATERSQTMFELQAGVIGPAALGEQVQNNYHRLINAKRLNGWDYQLKDEPTLNLLLEQRWRLPLGTLGGFETEFVPSLTGAAGNAAIYAGAGAMLRIGQGLDADWGPARIRPGLAGSSFFQPRRPFGWYAFAGVDGRAVGRDIFLDGNTFRDNGPSVDRRILVGEAQAGLAVYWGGTRLAYTQVVRSEEFYGQKGTQNFGSLSLSFRF